jgi:hypothetical protein
MNVSRYLVAGEPRERAIGRLKILIESEFVTKPMELLSEFLHLPISENLLEVGQLGVGQALLPQ